MTTLRPMPLKSWSIIPRIDRRPHTHEAYLIAGHCLTCVAYVSSTPSMASALSCLCGHREAGSNRVHLTREEKTFRRSTIEGTFRASLLVLILSEMTSSIGPLAAGIIIADFLGEKGISEFGILLASNYLLEGPESCVSGRSFLLSKNGSNW